MLKNVSNVMAFPEFNRQILLSKFEWEK